jgi:hypothetical protein
MLTTDQSEVALLDVRVIALDTVPVESAAESGAAEPTA